MISFTFHFTRCRINECDLDGSNRDLEYQQPWLQNVIPMSSNDTIDKCHRYASLNSTQDGLCEASYFDTSKKLKCTEFVYKTNEINLQTEVIYFIHFNWITRK